jgi:hypothetical protein
MFWRFGKLVHNLAGDPDTSERDGMGWTDDELKKNYLINMQLSYNRLLYDPKDIALADQPLHVEASSQRGRPVFALTDGMVKFLEHNLGAGKYLGSISTEQSEQYDDGCDINSVHVFEFGSIMYCHYGQGAGLSFRWHTSLPMLTGVAVDQLLDKFQSIVNQY